MNIGFWNGGLEREVGASFSLSLNEIHFFPSTFVPKYNNTNFDAIISLNHSVASQNIVVVGWPLKGPIY